MTGNRCLGINSYTSNPYDDVRCEAEALFGWKLCWKHLSGLNPSIREGWRVEAVR